MAKSITWSGVVAVHKDEQVLQSTLLRSPSLKKTGRVLIQRGYDSVAAAYNAGLRECTAEVAVFLHPDVYLPDSWEQSLANALLALQQSDPNWGVAGLYGMRRDGREHGFLYSTGRRGFIGSPFLAPQEIDTVDEFAFAIRCASGLSCDEALPSAQFQLGATDLCLEANRRGMKNYVLPCFSLHNSNRWSHLGFKFWSCYLYIRRKWKASLPIIAPYATVTRGCGSMIKGSIRTLLGFRRTRMRTITRVDDPVALYEELRCGVLVGFERLSEPSASTRQP